MARKVRPVLQEILIAVEGIETAVAGRSFADFQREWLLRHGIQRGIEIISEASRHLPAPLLASYGTNITGFPTGSYGQLSWKDCRPSK